MAKLYRNNRAPLGNKITLVAGNSLPIKVEGLGSNRRHIVLKSRNPQLLTVSAVQVNDRMLEQSLRIEVRRDGIVTSQRTFLDAFLNDGTPALSKKDQTTAPLEVEVLPEIRLPADSTEVGMLTRMLLVENITPGLPNYKESDVVETMKWMRFVLNNRLQLGPKHFAAGNEVSSVSMLIRAPNQIEGFEQYPQLKTQHQMMLKDIVKSANDGSDKNNAKYRTFLQAAIDIASMSVSQLGQDPCQSGLYSWRTTGSGSPGSNFVFFADKGGQTFYTLSDDFLSKAKK
ncbi:hypothetical protein C4K68_20770 [Pokkaliibacter plantistimulans]|uniref:Uncharacterized protein n=1 Tax=Proteobacteria bacterium 228 TaxID=2083153 RepID=A0A2S5KL05_9PROT|nr:hypothetical protein [Pokkaliibacter plantistimulans]PPC75402.1 hypothetical protein C4K68_20770 [Pokkaliibacter plantistimulans]